VEDGTRKRAFFSSCNSGHYHSSYHSSYYSSYYSSFSVRSDIPHVRVRTAHDMRGLGGQFPALDRVDVDNELEHSLGVLGRVHKWGRVEQDSHEHAHHGHIFGDGGLRASSGMSLTTKTKIRWSQSMAARRNTSTMKTSTPLPSHDPVLSKSKLNVDGRIDTQRVSSFYSKLKIGSAKPTHVAHPVISGSKKRLEWAPAFH
jgi:hypothetical protein